MVVAAVAADADVVAVVDVVAEKPRTGVHVAFASAADSSALSSVHS